MTSLAPALAYAAADCPVFPCKATADKAAGSKAPWLGKESTPGARDGGHWLASTDTETIRGWWRRWPEALIGYPTGRRSGCVVIDLDPKDCPVGTMLEALTGWCRQLLHVDAQTGEIMEPAIARTQSGGLHLYFAWPDAAIFDEIAANLARLGKPVTGLIGNKADVFRAFLKAGECPPALAHIDVRAEGGYVIAPPSVMSDGRSYEWLIPRGQSLPPLPRRLRGVITGEFITQAERAQRRLAARRPAARFDGRDIENRRVKAYVERAIAGALSDARSAGEGRRNQAVFEAAVSLSRFVRSGHLGKAEAQGLLLANLPMGVSAGEVKIRGTIESGLAASRVPAFAPEQLGASRDSGRAA